MLWIKRKCLSRGFGMMATLLFAVPMPGSASAAQTDVITLTQIPCQFIESENGIDRGYTTTKKADCDAINARTGARRVAESKPLVLKPGKYIFRVTNKDVPYDLGFWLRTKGYNWLNPVHKLTMTSVSGGGLAMGKTQDYEVDLKAGEYVYSCPLNTTPDYVLRVED